MITSIKCPACGKIIEISEALKDEIKDKTLLEIQQKHLKEIEQVKRQIEEKTIDKLTLQFDQQLKIRSEELSETKLRNRQLIEELSQMNKLIRDLKRKDEERVLEMEKKLTEKEEKIRFEAIKQAEERERLKLLEKEKQLSDAIKVNEELKRKLQQGSQQLQGEVLELELEKILKNEFPTDKITGVVKGIRGADIIQEIWDKTGKRCGMILWEVKNAKWNNEWIEKLKEDQRRIKADLAVLVCETLPDGIKTAGYRSGIWITSCSFAPGFALPLRANVIQAFYIRRSVQGKNEKMEVLYNYLSGVEFTQRLEAIIKAFTHMQEEMEREKRWFAAKWARQEKQIRGAIDHTLGMHGNLKGIMGMGLPELKSLESPNEENR